MNKKILILGAGNAQIDLIRYCKSIGLETYGCSYINTDKGIPLLDHFAQINIIDVDAIKNYAVENQIDYIYSIGSDIAVPTFCKAAEELGKFHFVSSETAEICCNKHIMRKVMGESSFNLPFLTCSTYAEAEKLDFYPVMLKPVDSQGQRGVYLIQNSDELKEYFDKSLEYSKSGKVILESYISGDEVSVNAYIKNNQVLFSIISDRESFKNLPGGIIKAHHLPSVYEGTETADKINELVHEAVKKLKITNGPAYFQIKVCNGNPYLIEATPRLDGCHMWNLINRYCGVNLLELTMKHFFGEDIEIGEYIPDVCPMHLEFFCEPPEAIFYEDKYINYFSDYNLMYYQTGDKVRKLNGYMEKCGYRIYKSPHKIGVIGGSGFVGKSFIQMYNKDFELKEISRQSGVISNYSVEQLENVLSGCDSVVILAAKKVNSNEEQSLSLYYDNISIVENTLIACRRLGITNIVYTSSRCIYSNNQNVPISENGLIEPINYYGISKLASEQLCIYYNKKFGLKIKILRLSQIIGKDKNGYMLDNFINNALTGNPLTVYGMAVGKRDYIYIKDVCRSILLALMHYNNFGVYNIGSGEGTSSKELAEAVICGFNSASEYIMLTDKQEDTSITYLDVSKAKEELGFTCKFCLKEAFADLKNLYL